MKENIFKKYKWIIILFLIYLVVGSFAIYAVRTVPCGEFCVPEKSFIHPSLTKLSSISLMILIGPTLPVLIPVLNLMGAESSEGIGIIILYFSTIIIWISYFLVLKLIYLFIKKYLKRFRNKYK